MSPSPWGASRHLLANFYANYYNKSFQIISNPYVSTSREVESGIRHPGWGRIATAGADFDENKMIKITTVKGGCLIRNRTSALEPTKNPRFEHHFSLKNCKKTNFASLYRVLIKKTPKWRIRRNLASTMPHTTSSSFPKTVGILYF